MHGADKMQPLTTRLGAYEIIRPLAKGGMAQLYLVRNTGPEGFEKLLVLKKILPHYAENPRFVRAFLDEAKLVAGFDHPHIAHVHDMGTADGSYFFTMEFVHGVDLRTIFRRYKREGRALPIDLAVKIVRDIASALHYAHERRGADGKMLDVVHRDVSPSNIIVSYEGVPKLIDFGIAKAASSTVKTQTGALKGKISYMSPEQAKGAPIDRRTDVFALGVVLWELVANRRLFGGPNDMATIQRIIHERVGSPRALRPECPPALERIVARALALDINERYQTAEQLQVDLEDFALEHKWKQSASLLAAELKKTFAIELKLWEDAQAGTVTVTDFAARIGDLTTRQQVFGPVEDDDEDDDEDNNDISIAPTVSGHQLPVIPPVPPAVLAASHVRVDATEADPPSVVLRREGRRRRWPLVAGALAAIAIAVSATIALRGDEIAPTRSTPAAAPVAVPPPVSEAPVSEARPPVVESPLPPRAPTIADPPAGEPRAPTIADPPAVEPRAPTVAEPSAVEEIEMPPATAAKPTKPRPKAKSVAKPAAKPVVKPAGPKPKPEVKPVEEPKPKPKPKFDPDAVFPPS